MAKIAVFGVFNTPDSMIQTTSNFGVKNGYLSAKISKTVDFEFIYARVKLNGKPNHVERYTVGGSAD